MKIPRYCFATLMTLYLVLPLAAQADGVTSIGVTSVERVSLRADGQEAPTSDGSASDFSDLSDDGNIVVFETVQRLVGADLDTFRDIYVRNRQAGTVVRPDHDQQWLDSGHFSGGRQLLCC